MAAVATFVSLCMNHPCLSDEMQLLRATMRHSGDVVGNVTGAIETAVRVSLVRHSMSPDDDGLQPDHESVDVKVVSRLLDSKLLEIAKASGADKYHIEHITIVLKAPIVSDRAPDDDERLERYPVTVVRESELRDKKFIIREDFKPTNDSKAKIYCTYNVIVCYEFHQFSNDELVLKSKEENVSEMLDAKPPGAVIYATVSSHNTRMNKVTQAMATLAVVYVKGRWELAK